MLDPSLFIYTFPVLWITQHETLLFDQLMSFRTNSNLQIIWCWSMDYIVHCKEKEGFPALVMFSTCWCTFKSSVVCSVWFRSAIWGFDNSWFLLWLSWVGENSMMWLQLNRVWHHCCTSGTLMLFFSFQQNRNHETVCFCLFFTWLLSTFDSIIHSF